MCERHTVISTSCQGSMLPSITNVINLADSHDRAAFAMATHIKQEPRERESNETKEEVTYTDTHKWYAHTKDLARSISQHIYWIGAMQQFWEKIELLLPLAFYGSACFNSSHIPHLTMVSFLNNFCPTGEPNVYAEAFLKDELLFCVCDRRWR